MYLYTREPFVIVGGSFCVAMSMQPGASKRRKKDTSAGSNTTPNGLSKMNPLESLTVSYVQHRMCVGKIDVVEGSMAQPLLEIAELVSEIGVFETVHQLAKRFAIKVSPRGSYENQFERPTAKNVSLHQHFLYLRSLPFGERVRIGRALFNAYARGLGGQAVLSRVGLLAVEGAQLTRDWVSGVSKDKTVRVSKDPERRYNNRWPCRAFLASLDSACGNCPADVVTQIPKPFFSLWSASWVALIAVMAVCKLRKEIPIHVDLMSFLTYFCLPADRGFGDEMLEYYMCCREGGLTMADVSCAKITRFGKKIFRIDLRGNFGAHLMSKLQVYQYSSCLHPPFVP